MRRFTSIVFQRLWAVSRGLRRPDRFLVHFPSLTTLGRLMVSFWGVLLNKMLLYWSGRVTSSVIIPLRLLTVFQRLWAICGAFWRPDSLLSDTPVVGICAATNDIVLEFGCHMKCSCIGPGKRPRRLKSQCAHLLYFNGSGPPVRV